MLLPMNKTLPFLRPGMETNSKSLLGDVLVNNSCYSGMELWILLSLYTVVEEKAQSSGNWSPKECTLLVPCML